VKASTSRRGIAEPLESSSREGIVLGYEANASESKA
jgi:hypothetical protein